MILCVNPNAAVDRTLVVDNFRLNYIHRPTIEVALPGGKGCNVARAAMTLGLQPVVAGWVGGHAGQFIEDGLRAEGILTAFVHTAAESRDCISILDSSTGGLTEIYGMGRPVLPDELHDFYALFVEWLPKVDLVTMSGSLPPGIPVDFYARLIGLVHQAGKPAILDTSGEPLRVGLDEGRPAVVKCNRAELSSLVEKPLKSLDEVRQAIRDLAEQLEIQVIVTLGMLGAIAAEPGKTWLAQAPRIDPISPVGSGDTFLAGLACGLTQNNSMEECLRLATAAGSANALQIGAGCLRRSDAELLYEQVRVVEEPA